MADGFLIKQEKYLEAGIHIGTKLRVIDMTRFIYRTRNDGLYVLDLRKVDERIRLAGQMLSRYEPKDIVVVASRAYSSMAAAKFAQVAGVQVIGGRFVPGRFTNVSRADFVEPKLVIICDPKGERQAVVECGRMGLPTLGLCDTDNFTMFIDWVIPCNNKGRRSLALIFWLLAREMALGGGKVASYDEFKPTLEEFEALGSEPAPAAPATEGAQAAQGGIVAPVAEAAAEPAAPPVEAAGEEEEEKKGEGEETKAKPKKAARSKKTDNPEEGGEKKEAAPESKTAGEKNEAEARDEEKRGNNDR